MRFVTNHVQRRTEMRLSCQRFLLLVVLGIASCATTKPSIDIAEQTTLANAGDPVAQNKLGIAYDAGIGTQRDMAKAVMWYRKSAEQGNADAQNSMGSLYQSGDGVPKDSTQAVYWYQKAAAQGHTVAQNSLAIRYLKGQGVDKDAAKALYWYEEAAKGGNFEAMRNLGEIYASGRGVDRNSKEAYKWFDLARFYTQFSRDMNLKWGVRGQLEKLTKEMTKSEIAEAKQLANEWSKKYGQGKSN